MIIADSHVHSAFSSDSTAPVESMIEAAIANGFTRFYLTDHMDFDFPIENGFTFTFNPDLYIEKLFQLTHQYKGKIEIFKGLEIGLKPYLGSRYDALMNKYDFDFVIGSTHVLNNGDPFHQSFWQEASEQSRIEQYFQCMIDNIKGVSNFDVCGHLDYIIRYAPSKNENFVYKYYADLIDEILLLLIQSHKGIEINTAGYKYGLNHPHPQEDIIQRYFELGGEIMTIGSDAHTPKHIAYDFQKVKEMLLHLGVKYYTVFEKRQPVMLRL
jgi:histidinol-phosphatase (PHP family)